MSDNQAQGTNQICTKEALKYYLKYYYYLFHLLDFTVGILLCIDAYFVISPATLDSASNFSRFVIPLYYFIFGFTIMTLIFYVPPAVSAMAMFYWTSFGRFFILLFLSAQLMSFASSLDVAVGIFVGSVSLIYLIFAFLTIGQCPVLKASLPPPIFQRNEAEKQNTQPNKTHNHGLLIAINSGSVNDFKSDEEMKDKVAEIANNQDIQTKYIELKNVDKSNAVEKMINLGLLSHIFVKKNAFERYAERDTYWNMLVAETVSVNEDKAYDCEYVKMHALNMMNNDFLTNLNEEQAVEFEKLLLYSLEAVDKLYMVQLTGFNLNSTLLQKIINTLIERSKDVNKCGPEEFHCDSNGITDVEMECIVDYIAENDKDLKVIKVGELLCSSSSEICKLCTDVLSEKNEYLLQFCVNIDVESAEYQTKIEQALKRNNDMFKENNERKQMHRHNETVGLPDNLLELTSNFTLPELEAPNLIAEITFPPIERGTDCKVEEKTHDESEENESVSQEEKQIENELENDYFEVIEPDTLLTMDVEVVEHDSLLTVDIDKVIQETKEEIVDTAELEDNYNVQLEDFEGKVNDIHVQVVINGDDADSLDSLESEKMSTDWSVDEESSLVQEVGLYLKVNMMNVKEMSKQDWKAIAGQHNENFWDSTGFKGRSYKDCKSRYKKVGGLLRVNDTPQTDGDGQIIDFNMVDQSPKYEAVVTDYDNFV